MKAVAFAAVIALALSAPVQNTSSTSTSESSPSSSTSVSASATSTAVQSTSTASPSSTTASAAPTPSNTSTDAPSHSSSQASGSTTPAPNPTSTAGTNALTSYVDGLVGVEFRDLVLTPDGEDPYIFCSSGIVRTDIGECDENGIWSFSASADSTLTLSWDSEGEESEFDTLSFAFNGTQLQSILLSGPGDLNLSVAYEFDDDLDQRIPPIPSGDGFECSDFAAFGTAYVNDTKQQGKATIRFTEFHFQGNITDEKFSNQDITCAVPSTPGTPFQTTSSAPTITTTPGLTTTTLPHNTPTTLFAKTLGVQFTDLLVFYMANTDPFTPCTPDAVNTASGTYSCDVNGNWVVDQTATTEETLVLSFQSNQSLTTASPAPSTAPASSTTAPASSTTAPASSTTAPASSTTAPASSTTAPASSTTAPASSTTAPASSTSAPASSTPNASSTVASSTTPGAPNSSSTSGPSTTVTPKPTTPKPTTPAPKPTTTTTAPKPTTTTTAPKPTTTTTAPKPTTTHTHRKHGKTTPAGPTKQRRELNQDLGQQASASSSTSISSSSTSMTSATDSPSTPPGSTTTGSVTSSTPAPSNTTTPAPSNTTTPAPSNTTTPAPSNTTTPAPSNTTTPAPSTTTVAPTTTTTIPTTTTTTTTTTTLPPPVAFLPRQMQLTFSQETGHLSKVVFVDSDTLSSDVTLTFEGAALQEAMNGWQGAPAFTCPELTLRNGTLQAGNSTYTNMGTRIVLSAFETSFSVSADSFPSSADQCIIPSTTTPRAPSTSTAVAPTGSTTNPGPTNTPAPSKKSKGMGTGALAGISIAALIVVFGLGAFLYRRMRTRRLKEYDVINNDDDYSAVDE